MSQSKRKGSDFERDVAKILSRWWAPDLYKKGELVFWRTHASGAASHISSKQLGDITYINECGRPLLDLFVIECKRTRRFNLFGVIAGDKSVPLLGWLRKLRVEAGESGRYGLLVFKLDRYPIMCAVDVYVSKKLCYLKSQLNGKKILRLYKPYPFDFYLFSDFLSIVDRDTILECLNSCKK